jgi:hypothetical protein
LNRAAFNLGQLVARRLLEIDEVRTILLAAALEAGNPETEARPPSSPGCEAARPSRAAGGTAPRDHHRRGGDPPGGRMASSFLGSARLEAVGPLGGVVVSGTGEVGPLKLGALKVGAAHVGTAQIRPPQIRVLQMGLVEVGTAQPCSLQVCLAQISVFQISAVQPNAGHLGTGQVRVPEQRIGQPGVMQEGATQIDPRQVQLKLIAYWWAPAQHDHGYLDIGRAEMQPGQLPVNGWGRMLGPLWRANQPGGMGADICSEDGLDGASVRWRVRGDAFQGVEPAKAHVLLVVAELIDRAAESLSDLAFSADLELPPTRDRANDQQQAGDPLQQRGPSIVLQLCLPLLQLDPPFGTVTPCSSAGDSEGCSSRGKASTHTSSNATAATARTTDREPGCCIPVHPFSP